MKSVYQVIVIDDDLILADLIRERINKIIGFNCDHIFADPWKFLLSDIRSDIVLLDVVMGEINGLDAIEPILEKIPCTSIIMNTIKDDTETIFHAIKKGAVAYIDKQSYFGNFEDVLKTVATGGAYMTPTIALKVFNSFRSSKPTFENLSPREKDVTESILDGLTYNQIAHKLGISIDTVRMNVKSIYKKLKINSKAQLFNVGKK